MFAIEQTLSSSARHLEVNGDSTAAIEICTATKLPCLDVAISFCPREGGHIRWVPQVSILRPGIAVSGKQKCLRRFVSRRSRRRGLGHSIGMASLACLRRGLVEQHLLSIHLALELVTGAAGHVLVSALQRETGRFVIEQ